MIEIPEYTGCTTYCIENTSTGKKYIGRTTNYRRRIKQHLKDLDNGNHPNGGLLCDYQKGDCFVVYPLEEQKERDAIKKYDTISNGYNKVIPKGNIEPKIGITFAGLGRLLKQQGKTWFYLRENGISPGIVNKLRYDTGYISTKTVLKLCDMLDCQPGDILEYIPDTTRTKKLHDPKEE